MRQAATNMLAGVPTQAERNGDLTNLLYNGTSPLMYDPLGSVVTGADGNPYRTTLLGGNGLIVPASQISPMSAAIDKDIPPPNAPGTAGFTQLNNYIGQQSSGNNDDTWNTRIDENFTEHHRLSFQFKRDNSYNYQSEWLGTLDPPFGVRTKQGLSSSLSYVYTISPTTILTARFGVNLAPVIRGSTWPSTFNSKDWPYDPTVKSFTDQTRLPFATVIGSQGGWGSTRLVNTIDPKNNIQMYNNFNPSLSLTKIWGKHTIKVGAEHRRYYDNFVETGLGWMIFDGYATEPNAWGGTYVQSNQNMVAADSFGDYLLGYLDYTQQAGPTTFAWNFNYWAGYVQDDWKINRI